MLCIYALPFSITTATITPTYYSYKRTKSTRIECLIDIEIIGIDGEIPDNSFDSITNYIGN